MSHRVKFVDPQQHTSGRAPGRLQSREMKPSAFDDRQNACRRKRRYACQGDALDAASLAGVERERRAYRCPICGHWHLATRGSEEGSRRRR